MAGLLGDIGGFLTDPMTQLGAGLLGGTSPFAGVNIGNAFMQTAALQQQQKKEQRAQDQADLAQLVQSYKILQDQDQQAKRNAYLTGAPYQPNPLLAVHEQKLAKMLGAGAPQAISQAPQASATQQQSPAAPAVPAAIASQYSSAVRPEFQGQGSMPQAPQQQTPQAPQQSMPQLPQLLAGAGISPEMAMVWAGTEKGTEQMMKQLSEVYAPRVVNNVLMQLQPNGQTRMLGGMVGQDSAPVVAGPDGQLRVKPVQGLTDYFANKAGAVEGATQAAKAPYTPITIPNANGSATTMMLNRFMGSGAPQAAPQDAPQGGQPAALTVTEGPRAGSGASFGTSQTPGDRSQQEDLGKYFGNQFILTQQAGQSAASNRQKMDRMQQLMEGINTTGMTPTGMRVASLARGIGVDLDPKLPQKEAFQAMAGQLALELRNPAGGAGMPGSLSDNDLKFLKSITPGLAQTPDGRKLMFETKSKLLQRDEEVAQLARSYYKQNGKMDAGFDQIRADYANSHPLFPSAEAPSNKSAELDALVEQYRSKK